MNNQDMFYELERRFKLDQDFLNKKNYNNVIKDNSKWLKDILKEGWLQRDILGEKGEFYEWLIVQHSESITFQKRYLDFLKNLPKNKKRKQNIAYLKDRVLVKEGKKQLYGTQFYNKEPLPIYNPDNLDKRRKNMNLEPFEKYSRIIQKYTHNS